MQTHTQSLIPADIGSSTGLTLIELLVLIAILSVLLGIASPSFSNLLSNQHQISQTNQLLGQLMYARSEAIKRGEWVAICKSADGEFCTTDGNWEQGWIIYEDGNRNRSRDPGETLLLSHQVSGQLRIRYSAYPAYSSNRYAIYYPDGSSLGNGTFTFCDGRGDEYAYSVILARSGRARSAQEKADGSSLDCNW